MKKVFILSTLLLTGLVLSQVLPVVVDNYSSLNIYIKMCTIICLAFIMIHVGYEFEIRKDKIKDYGYDYLIAFSAATLPWIFVTIYFVYALTPDSFRSGETWINSLLIARFASPTSAGVLFSMLTAAGLASTWMFKKTRVLAIFDDLDTVILMIPLQMLIIGFKFELLFVMVIMIVQVLFAWRHFNSLQLSIRWKNVLFYAVIISGTAEIIYYLSKAMYETVGVHIEVLLPAFILGSMISKKHNYIRSHENNQGEDILEQKKEKTVSYIVSAVFMLFVGLSMPPLEGFSGSDLKTQHFEIVDAALKGNEVLNLNPEQTLNWETIIFHVLIVTLLSNIGKMVPAFVYRREASWRERLAVAIAMFPRGEVGAGVLIISMSYGIGGPIVTIAMLSLALNLLLTGLFIMLVKSLLKNVPNTQI
ncbi:MAG TPA: hypothetical protein VIH09_11270 [Flavobacterium sp.]|uniref:hypothetical protein n=1 Tax=Flavobacterium sp. TaxID=239 RepID=UPI002F41C48C